MIETKFKKTHIGEIPDEWEIHTIKEHLKLLTDYDANGSFADIAENVQTLSGHGYAWFVRATDLEQNTPLNRAKYVDARSYSFLKKSSLHGGELLIAKRGDIGKVYLFKMKTNKATLAPNLYLLKLKESISCDFLYRYLSSSYGQKSLKSINSSTSLGAIYKEDVKSLSIPYPTSYEQQRIATTLNDIDTLLSTLNKKIEKKKLIKQGAMQQLLTGKKRLAGFSEPWVEKELEEILSIGNGKDYKHLHCGLVPVFGTGGILCHVNDWLYEGETVCIGRKGTINEPIYHNGKIWTVDTLFYTYNFTNSYPKFIYYLFQTIDWLMYNEATGIPSLSKANIYQIHVSIPTLSEQTAIATLLSDMDKEIEELEAKQAKYEQIKQGMMQQLLTGKIRLID